jgi:hypothetical protein
MEFLRFRRPKQIPQSPVPPGSMALDIAVLLAVLGIAVYSALFL